MVLETQAKEFQLLLRPFLSVFLKFVSFGHFLINDYFK